MTNLDRPGSCYLGDELLLREVHPRPAATSRDQQTSTAPAVDRALGPEKVEPGPVPTCNDLRFTSSDAPEASHTRPASTPAEPRITGIMVRST
ncbi:hypothetical protein ACFWDK_05070 [Micromonospora chalcea]